MAEANLKDFPTLFSLRGKVCVVTGGSRGLGLSAASALLQSGASKVFISSRKADACTAACATLNSLPNLSPGAVAIPAPADSATEAGVLSLLAAVKSHLRPGERVDVLLANAGASWGAPLDSHPDSAFAKVMDLNVRGVFNTVKLFAPLMQRGPPEALEDPARVIITGSVAGLGVGTLGKQGTVCFSFFFFLPLPPLIFSPFFSSKVGGEKKTNTQKSTDTAPPKQQQSTWAATWPWSWAREASASTASRPASSPPRWQTACWS